LSIVTNSILAQRLWPSGKYAQLVLGLIIVAVAFAIALLPLPIIAIIGIGILVILLTMIEPVLGLYLAILSVPIQEQFHLPFGVSYTQAAMLLLVATWVLRVLAYPKQQIQKSWVLPFWLAMLWALLLSAGFTPYSQTEALKETFRWGEAFLVWLIVFNLVRKPWQIAGLIACILVAPAADAVIGLYQFFTGDGPESFRISAESLYVRAYGTIGAPNSFAGYLNMAWPLAVSLSIGLAWQLLKNWKKPTQDSPFSQRFLSLSLIFVGLCMVLLLSGLLASFSRGGWLGAMAGVVALAIALGRPYNRWVIGLLLIGVLGLLFGGVNLLPPAMADRINSILRSISFFDVRTVTVTNANFAQVERMAHFQAALNMFLAQPLTGVGAGNFNIAFSDFTSPPWFASRGHAHNYYLHMAGEAGIIGLVTYLALLTATLKQVYDALRHANGIIWRSIVIGCCGIIAAVSGHELFENLHALSMGIQIAAIWGLISVLAQAPEHDQIRSE
jgi:O-antigen ligase